MSIGQKSITVLPPLVNSWEHMHSLICSYGIIPFFENPIVGFSIEEHTPPDCWFHDDFLGPWDWKIECVQSGDIAYGKFLWGGKAAFATVEVYDILRVYRGSDLHYNGWQRSSFCSPEALFEDLDFPFPGFRPRTMQSALTPQESLAFVKETVRQAVGDVSEKLLDKMLL